MIKTYTEKSSRIFPRKALSDRECHSQVTTLSNFYPLLLTSYFCHGKADITTWKILKTGVDTSINLELLLATYTRSLERRAELSPMEKSTQFLQYAIINKLLSNFCASLTKNLVLMEQFYEPGCIMASVEHSTMFVLQLNTLELLNFSSVWAFQGNFNGSISMGRQVTILQSCSSSNLNSPGSDKISSASSTPNSSFKIPPVHSQSSKLQQTVSANPTTSTILFGSANEASAPLTFSLKPRGGNINSNYPFSQAFAPTSSPPPAYTIQTEGSASDASTLLASSSASASSLNSTPISPLTSASASPPISPPASNSISTSEPVPTPTIINPPEHLLAAVEIKQMETTQAIIPGSAKKRPKKRTVEL